MSKPNCYKCIHCKPVPGDAHKRCNNTKANVEGDPYGIKMGWFFWPVNFDPTWLRTCDGFSDNPKDELPDNNDPIMAIAAMLGKRL